MKVYELMLVESHIASETGNLMRLFRKIVWAEYVLTTFNAPTKVFSS
jgi:hypothetical protein